MNALPDYIVMDFCEWLKHLRKKPYYFDEFNKYGKDALRIHQDEFVRLAKKYIEEMHSVRGILHKFIDSNEFKQVCEKEMLDHYDLDDISHGDFNSLLNSNELLNVFQNFCDREYLGASGYRGGQSYLTPDFLIDSLLYYMDYRSFEIYFKDYTIGKDDFCLEVDFLEWLLIYNGEKIDLSKMPLSEFEKLVDEYCTQINCSSRDREKLINSFKHSDVESFGGNLLRVLRRREARKLKSLRYIYDRFTNDLIPYRCIILPYGSESDKFKDLITNFYYDLNSMSDNYLDIYYSIGDLEKSGYEIKNNIQSFPKSLSEKLPCVVLWEHDMKKAQTIDIVDLTNKELVRLMAIIVDLIKAEKPFDLIVKEATKVADEIRKEHIDSNRPITNNTYYVENNAGIVADKIVNSTVTVNSGAISKDILESESEKAIEIINSFKDVEESYRNTLIELVKEASASVQSNDEVAQKNCKINFDFFMKGAGKTVGAIVTKLSELATIASFFGITASTFL